MGLWSWLFPSADDRVARARHLLDVRRYAAARDEVRDLDRPDAQEIVREAENGLCRLNVEEALRWAAAGEEARVQQHLALAEELHKGGLEAELRDARRQIREAREARERQAREEASQAARLTQADPLGLTGRSLLKEGVGKDLAAQDDEDRRQRAVLMVENYPESLREDVARLGKVFVDAVLDLDEGRPDLAMPVLAGLPEHPLVCYEVARCCYALNDAPAGARALQRFAALAGRHMAIGPEHTGSLCAQMLAETGDVAGALRVLRDVRATEPTVGSFLFAQLLEVTQQYAEAEGVVRELAIKHPREQQLALMLARVRIAGGHRLPAMQALEASLSSCCEVPGKCGYQPPDLRVLRTLATLYLEDGIETSRALELADQADGLIQQPTWEDAYLHALVAKQRREPEFTDAVRALWEHTPAEDPRHARLERFLPLPA